MNYRIIAVTRYGGVFWFCKSREKRDLYFMGEQKDSLIMGSMKEAEYYKNAWIEKLMPNARYVFITVNP